MRRTYLSIVAATALTLALAPSSDAGTADDPEMTDPTGDVAAEGVPLPAGADWADLEALWMEMDDDGSLSMNIRVAAVTEGPPGGEVAALLEVDGTHILAGWSSVLPPMVVPYYQGGFYCPATAEGAVDPAQCQATPWTVAENVFWVSLPADALGIGPGSVVEIPYVYSQVWYLDAAIRLDEGQAQRAFIVPQSAAPDTARVPDARQNGTHHDADGPAVDPDETPKAPAGRIGLAVAVLSGAALWARRRRA